MRRMVTDNQIEEIVKQNSTQLYKHNFKMVLDDLEPVNNAPEFFIVNNDPTNLTYTINETTLQHFDAAEFVDIFPSNKVIFPYVYCSNDTGSEWVFFAPLELYQEVEQNEFEDNVYSLLITDFTGNFELTIIDGDQDNRQWIGMKYLDTVEAL